MDNDTIVETIRASLGVRENWAEIKSQLNPIEKRILKILDGVHQDLSAGAMELEELFGVYNATADNGDAISEQDLINPKDEGLAMVAGAYAAFAGTGGFDNDPVPEQGLTDDGALSADELMDLEGDIEDLDFSF